jgi:hypothetical protein
VGVAAQRTIESEGLAENCSASRGDARPELYSGGVMDRPSAQDIASFISARFRSTGRAKNRSETILGEGIKEVRVDDKNWMVDDHFRLLKVTFESRAFLIGIQEVELK